MVTRRCQSLAECNYKIMEYRAYWGGPHDSQICSIYVHAQQAHSLNCSLVMQLTRCDKAGQAHYPFKLKPLPWNGWNLGDSSFCSVSCCFAGIWPLAACNGKSCRSCAVAPCDPCSSKTRSQQQQRPSTQVLLSLEWPHAPCSHNKANSQPYPACSVHTCPAHPVP